MFCKAKSATTKKTFFLRGNFRPLPNKNVQMLDHFFPFLFSKDSESLKIMDIRLRELGAKRPLNGTSKVNRQTDKQTHTRTFRLIESIGPEGRCFENIVTCGGWTFSQNFSSLVFVFAQAIPGVLKTGRVLNRQE